MYLSCYVVNIVPFRSSPLAESAGSSDIESWLKQSDLDSSQVSKVLESVNISQSRVERTYSAYADEPLTSSVDTLDTSVSMLSHVFRYTSE